MTDTFEFPPEILAELSGWNQDLCILKILYTRARSEEYAVSPAPQEVLIQVFGVLSSAILKLHWFAPPTEW